LTSAGYLGRRFSKHKITRYATNFMGTWPPGPAVQKSTDISLETTLSILLSCCLSQVLLYLRHYLDF